ncbi:MAG: hypothetical protein KGL35_08255 [Bradyrhizobium sp.]|nr:hypothetical protein [Bradyrhizobium sp.]
MSTPVKVTIGMMPDGKTARLAIGAVAVDMGAEQLEEFIAGLADIRSRLSPAVSDRPPAGRPIHEFQNPEGSVGGDPQTHEVVLAFRTATIGWLNLRFSPEKARQMASLLTTTAEHTEQLARSRAN